MASSSNPDPTPNSHPTLNPTPTPTPNQVEGFQLLRADELLLSLRNNLPLWKPNSALVTADVAMRHGLVGPDEPGYVEMAHLLRAGGVGV